MAAVSEAAQAAQGAAHFLTNIAKAEDQHQTHYPDTSEIYQRLRDIAAIAATRASNVESRKYPGLVCGEPSILLLNEDIITKILEGKHQLLSLFGDVVFLPDDLGGMFPDLLEFTCSSKYLVALPTSMRKMQALKSINVNGSGIDTRELRAYLPSLTSSDKMSSPKSLKGAGDNTGISATLIRHDSMIDILLERIEQLEAKLTKPQADTN